MKKKRRGEWVTVFIFSLSIMLGSHLIIKSEGGVAELVFCWRPKTILGPRITFFTMWLAELVIVHEASCVGLVVFGEGEVWI